MSVQSKKIKFSKKLKKAILAILTFQNWFYHGWK